MSLRFVLPLLALVFVGFFALGLLSSTACRVPVPSAAVESPSSDIAESVDEPRGSGSSDAGGVTEPLDYCGDLLVRAVDPISRAGLVGIECVVYESVVERKPLAIGSTGADGTVLFRGLPRGSLDVETLRAPPRAAAAGAAWIEDDVTVQCELDVGLGGTLFGRVVDDAGAPVADLEIELAPTWAEELAGRAPSGFGVPAARTDAEGRFRIAALSSPRSWACNRVAQWWYWREPIGISAGPSATLYGQRPAYYVLEGEEIDAGDLVVDRERVHAGRVVGPGGRGVGGALVSAHPKRIEVLRSPRELRARPGAPEFELLPGETTTAEDGTFELTVRGDAQRALVWTPRGTRETFTLPAVAPGERNGGLAWRIERDEVLEIEIFPNEPRAAPVSEGAPRVASFALESTRGDRVDLSVGRDADGRYRVTLPFERTALAALRVRLAGFAPVAVEGEGLRDDVVSIALEPLPQLRFSIGVSTQPDFDRRSFSFAACRLAPAARATQRCCGRARHASAEWWIHRDGVFPVDLTVDDSSERWLYVSDTTFFAEQQVHAFGPFVPGGERIAIALPPTVATAEAKERGRGRASDRTSAPQREIELFVVDEDSGRPIELAHTEWGFGNGSDARGRLLANVSIADSEAVVVEALGFEDATVPLTWPEGAERVRLGEVGLTRESGQPFVRFVDRDRDSTRGPYFASVIVASPSGGLDLAGTWRNGVLPEFAVPGSTVWVTGLPEAGQLTCLRNTRLPDPIPENSVVLELDAPREVEVRLVGLPDRELDELGEELEPPYRMFIVPVRSPDVPLAGKRRDPSALLLSPEPSTFARASPASAERGEEARTAVFRAGLSPGEFDVRVHTSAAASLSGTSTTWAEGFEPLRIHVVDASGVHVFELRYDSAE